MLAEALFSQFDWIEYSGQMESDVTYFFRSPKLIRRLRGESDILYIGRTENAIRVRYKQETRTNNLPKNTQHTNIRTTYVYRRLGMKKPECFYTKSLNVELPADELRQFTEKVMTWDKKFYLMNLDAGMIETKPFSMEKYLMVNYADEHLEVPPLNQKI
ncbi:MAG: hypothetical protein O7D86_12525 [Proteobacteria bacterium]|nr:hypothetical protein [Pseudomonadota bacterium]